MVEESTPVKGVALVSYDVFLVGRGCACVLVDRAGTCLSEG